MTKDNNCDDCYTLTRAGYKDRKCTAHENSELEDKIESLQSQLKESKSKNYKDQLDNCSRQCLNLQSQLTEARERLFVAKAALDAIEEDSCDYCHDDIAGSALKFIGDFLAQIQEQNGKKGGLYGTYKK